MDTPAPSGKPSRLEEARSEFSPAVSESVLTLRVAHGMVVPLQSSVEPTPWVAVRTRAVGTQAVAVPFRVSRTVVDPATKIKVSVSPTIESGLDSETVRLVVECNPIPQGRTWKVSLQNAEREEELARIPILQRQETIDTKLPYGFYVVELSSEEQSLCRFPFTIEPFSLPEALDAAEQYLAQSQYRRAVAVLEDAGARYPDSAEVWELLSVVEELAAFDPEAVRREEEEFGVFRGPRERFKGVGTVLQKVRSKFGESVASLLVARKLEPASVPDALLGKVKDQPVSLPALRALALLEERLKAAGDEARVRDERLVEALAGVTGRLGRIETLILDLGETINAIRAEKDSDAEQKLTAVGETVVRFMDGTKSAGVSLPDFAPFFQVKLGVACWGWIGDEAQKMFISAEDIYRYFAGSSTAETRDFTPALLEFCRGLELLLNFRLVKLCDTVRNLISGNDKLRDFVDRLTWARLKDTIEFKKSYTIPQVAISLRLGKAVEQKYPALLGKDGSQLLALSGLSDHQSICVLSHIGQIFRNGKVHPYPGSERMFTVSNEVRVLRKLLFGLDEERVDRNVFFSQFKILGFTQGAIDAAANSLSQAWSRFPGLIPKIWRTAESESVLKEAS